MGKLATIFRRIAIEIGRIPQNTEEMQHSLSNFYDIFSEFCDICVQIVAFLYIDFFRIL